MAKMDVKHEKVSISFVGEVIDRAVAELQDKNRTLPTDPRRARAAVEFAIKKLMLAKKTTKLRCRAWAIK